MTSVPSAQADRRLTSTRPSHVPPASGTSASAISPKPSNDAVRASARSSRAAAGPSRLSSAPAYHRPHLDDPVRAAQEEATRVWRADLRRLLERAEDRFADICWTTATPPTQTDQSDLDSDLGHSLPRNSGLPAPWTSPDGQPQTIPPISISQPSPSLTPTSHPSAQGSLIWAHKAILYARAPNTFQTRFLNLRSPAAQLQHIGSTASLVSLPLHRSTSQLSLASDVSTSTQTRAAPSNTSSQPPGPGAGAARAGIAPKPRRSIRGAAPPSSFSMTRPSLRKPISRSSISRPLQRASVDDAGSIASGFATSDSEGESALPSSLRTSRLVNTRPNVPAANASSLTSPSKLSNAPSSVPDLGTGGPARKSSFVSDSSAADSRLTADNASVVSDASTLRAPISLGGVSQAFFDATLQYLYTGEEAMVDAFEFLFEDRLAPDSEATPEEKLDKLRSDLTYMWRSKLYSDVKLMLGDDDDPRNGDDASIAGGKRRRASAKLMDIPDANMSVLSLAQTVDTDRIDESEDDDDELTSFSTHRMILASRSEYFASLLLSPYADAASPVLRLPSPPFTPASLHFTLGFLYTGTLFFSNRTFDLATAFSLWRAGAYLQISTLQALVTALIDREFCHGFACAPPCRKCVKRVPRALAFAASPDVSEPALQEPAIAAVAGAHFGMYWAKDVGNLDPTLQDRIVDAISARMTEDPTLVVAVLRQLSIVGQRIDTERSSRWVESLRLMAETVENRLMPLLHTHLERIVQSSAWNDLLDGVGSLGDVLEKSLVMLIDGLSEARAAQIYQILVGQVLLREQGFDVVHSRQAVETTRANIVKYLMKRWINVRALGGFNRLDKWCLKELADELEVATTDLLQPETPPKSVAAPSRLTARSSLPGHTAGGAAVCSAVGAKSTVSPLRSTAPATASRLRTTSTSSTASARRTPRDEGEREAGPIHMRAAVLNRNAARTSVANGHRSLSNASTASTSSASAAAATRPAASSPTIRAAGATSMSPAAKPRAPSVRSGAPGPASTGAANARMRTQSSTSTASVASVVSVGSVGSMGSTASVRTAARPAGVPRPRPSAAGPGGRSASVASTTRGADAAKAVGDVDKTPTKAVRPVRSATALAVRPVRPASSLDSATAKTQPKPTQALSAKSSFLRATPGPRGTFSLTSTDSGRDMRARTLSSTSPTSIPAAPRASTAPGAEGSMQRSDSSTTILATPDHVVAPGVALRVGIACIVSLDCVDGAAKVRAMVRYFGRVAGEEGMWVGVQLHLPAQASTSLRLSQGCRHGVRYFAPHPEQQAERQTRRERRSQLWQSVAPQSEFPDPNHPPAEAEQYDELLLPARNVVWVIQ